MNFGGCLLIVSHDRFFLDKLATHLFIFEGNGVIKDFNGTYSEYGEMLKEEEKQIGKGKKGAPAPLPQPIQVQKAKKMSFKEKREFEMLEAEISSLEKLKAELEQKLSSGNGSASDFAGWSKELTKTTELLNTKGEKWLELSMNE